jgi:hypothetical protein
MVTSSMHTNLSNFDHFGGAGIYEIGSLTFPRAEVEKPALELTPRRLNHPLAAVDFAYYLGSRVANMTRIAVVWP